MKSLLCLAPILAAGAALLASCAAPGTTETSRIPVSASMQSSGTNRSESQMATAVFNEINAYRQSTGSFKLKRHAGLDRLAQKHCEFLRQNRGSFSLKGKNVSHMGFAGRTLYAKQAYNVENISENVAATSDPGSNPAKTFLRLWKNSPDHHKNLKMEWTYSGIGVVVDDDGMAFATQIFATVGNFQMSSRERFLQH